MIADLERLVGVVRRRAADQAEAALREGVRSLRGGQQNLAEIERLVQAETRPIGQTVFEEALRTMGNGYDGAHRRCDCGSTLRYVSDRSKRLETLMGPITIRRAYYHCSNCGRGDVPLDRSLGVEGTSLTPAVQEVIAWTDAEIAFGRAREFLRRTISLQISKATHEEVSAQLGEAVQPGEAVRAEAASVSQGPAEQFYVMMDGVKVNTEEGWKEPKLGAVFRAHRDGKGQPIRGPTRYTGHLEPAESFGQRLWQLAEGAGVANARRVIVLGDGAPWIWTLADFYFPDAVQIVDWYHAVEKLWEVARRLWPEDAPKVKAWVKRRETALYQGRVGAVTRALRALSVRAKENRDVVRKAIGYFRANRRRMRYDRFRAGGYFIGSGVVEAACKHVIAQRFKQSGMRWSRKGFLRLLHLRLCILNGDWDRFARAHFPQVTNLQSTYF